MKKIIYILPFIFIMVACQKDKEVKVSYIVTKAISGFDISYRNADGKVMSEWVNTSSAEDRWNYNFTASEGDIVYVSARYYDITSAINVQILVDGKVYKQGSSVHDTVSYVTVSGTIPY